MFTGKIESNDTGALPERVLAMCQLIEKGPMHEDEIKEKMEPKYLGEKTKYFSFYKQAAEDIGLIVNSDKMISLAVEPKVIKNSDAMRKHINQSLESINDGDFYALTSAYFQFGKSILKQDKNMSNLASLFAEMTGRNIDSYAMRAWRFWVPFLGLGYLQQMFFIPNASVFLWDIISSSEFESGRPYAISEFVDKISPMANIILGDKIDKKFNFGVSNGLRALHDTNKIKMEHILDQADRWTLDELKGYSNDNTVTHITVL